MSRRSFAFMALAALPVMIACGSDAKPAAPASTPPPPVQRAAQTTTVDAGLPTRREGAPVEFSENDFVESDKSRDPFRSFARLFVEQNARPTRVQRDVILAEYTIDELKLVAIVRGSDYPRAMFVDPTGKGWVIKRGDFVGRPDLVHVGGTNGTDYQLNWRIEKIRDGDVVLIREDPAQPSIPPATRVLPLRPEAANNEGIVTRN